MKAAHHRYLTPEQAEHTALVDAAVREGRFYFLAAFLERARAVPLPRLRSWLSTCARRPEWLGDLAELPTELVGRAWWSGEYFFSTDPRTGAYGWWRKGRSPS